MYKDFITYISNLNKENAHYIIACSGGMDSSCLTHLFHRANLDFSLAHVNYNLRGVDSEKDALFVSELAEQYQVPFYLKSVDLKSQLQDQADNLQAKARSIRYDYFKELMSKKANSTLVTAHHSNDQIETSFINMMRGTGLAGISGFGDLSILRPLLTASRADIKVYITENNLSYREDASNATSKYLRNFLRNEIIPTLKQKYPNFDLGWRKTMSNLEKSNDLLEVLINDRIESLRTEDKRSSHRSFLIDQRIAPEQRTNLYYHYFKKHGFVYDQIDQILDSHTGSSVSSPGYELFKDRDQLILKKKMATRDFQSLSIGREQSSVSFSGKVLLLDCDIINTDFDSDILYLDANTMSYPLELRRWNDGDRFQAFGLKGKSLKVKDFLTNKKVSRPEKEETYVLLSQDKIVAILTHEIAYPNRVTQSTNRILALKVV